MFLSSLRRCSSKFEQWTSSSGVFSIGKPVPGKFLPGRYCVVCSKDNRKGRLVRFARGGFRASDIPARRGECGLHTDMSHALNPPRANWGGFRASDMPARRGECGLHTDMSHALNPPRANCTGARLPPSPLHPHLRSCSQRHQNTAVRSRSKSAKAELLRNISRNWSLGRCSL
jgi:hypothetical protein